MARVKKIEDEIKETEIKNEEILKELDINEVNTEAETIKDIKVKVFDKEYRISDLIKLIDKNNRTYEEIEVAKKFKLLIRNYYDGIMCALLRPCCGRIYTINDLKNKLIEPNSYKIIDVRCSRENIRFDKETVDMIINTVERYNLDR